MKPLNDQVVCKDGAKMSVQASQFHYCTPREDVGPYSTVECGFPKGDLPSWWAEYAEDPGAGAKTVAGYVPIELVQDWAVDHGGATNWPANLATEVRR